jgi:Tetratrico peptide repeat
VGVVRRSRRARVPGQDGAIQRDGAVGQAAESVELLAAERDRASDELDDAVSAFLALALVDTGREREAVALALAALAPHLPRYQRSLANYARELAG